MIATWKIRTDYANATDIFDKVSPWFKESGAQMSAMLLNIGGHDGTFTMAAAFENFEAFGKNDDAWSCRHRQVTRPFRNRNWTLAASGRRDAYHRFDHLICFREAQSSQPPRLTPFSLGVK